ncbi:CU044_5270 family protein [Actinokineospora fastidiosa]|uniref:CU044_5270 family protein n=1 Tax=Actinokineospora fastidiosa TaxID=1816 RepID=A0A918LF94_9PSEU|nr:CU044_5270 family protein [Actinokineospora fastidiosa]GGS39058.1 hypothetical protein GCM10010171_37510 [Actinokineospora fastidiosa]
MSDGGRHWTEQELDDALDRLNADVRVSDERLGEAKDRMLAEIDGGGRRRPRVVGVAASMLVVVGLVVALLVAQTENPLGPASAEAVATLELAAIEAEDTPVGPGRFRYVATHAWHLREIGRTAYLAETVTEVWAPAEYEREWEMRRSETGRRVWVLGSEAEALAAGLTVNPPGPAGLPVKARCGDFAAVLTGQPPCTTPGQWQAPTREFIAGLPREPGPLLDRLRADAPDHGRGDSQLLIYAADALRGGLLPADVRTPLFRALAMLQGLQITDNAANLDGRRGTAVGIDDGRVRQEIIIDPVTGVFVGERQVLTTESESGVPAGTVTGFTAVEIAVVDETGVRPN